MEVLVLEDLHRRVVENCYVVQSVYHSQLG